MLYCTYKDPYSGVIYRFKSRNLWTNPELVFESGDTIEVYVDEKDYRNYYVAAVERLTQKIVDFT